MRFLGIGFRNQTFDRSQYVSSPFLPSIANLIREKGAGRITISGSYNIYFFFIMQNIKHNVISYVYWIYCNTNVIIILRSSYVGNFFIIGNTSKSYTSLNVIG